MPASDRPRPRPNPPEALDASRPARIVVADDDRIGRDLLAGILRGAGHIVDPVEDGQEALERVAQGGVDLVLLDIVMPRLSGIEACRLLKGMTLDNFLPVMLVTVKTDSASRVEGLRIGADDYVCKPFEEAELLARVQSMLRIKRLHEQIVLQKARFERLSVHDELTGLYNFRFLHTRLNEEFKRAERYHEPFACLLVDIDQLRAFNDMGGRAAGDAIIQRVADSMRRSVREVDVIARYGGEEFLAVLPSTHFPGSVAVAERIWREVAEHVEPPFVGGPEPHEPERAPVESERRWADPRPLTVSIGVALYPSRDVRTKDALIRAAEAALSQAKREGGNRICVFQQQGYIYTPIPQGPPSSGNVVSIAGPPSSGNVSTGIPSPPSSGHAVGNAVALGNAVLTGTPGGSGSSRPKPSESTRPVPDTGHPRDVGPDVGRKVP